MIVLKKWFISILFLTISFFNIYSDNDFPFTHIKRISIKKQNRIILRWQNKWLVGIGKGMKEIYKTGIKEKDLSVYILNNYNNKIFFNNYKDVTINTHVPGSNEAKLLPGRTDDVLIGISEDEEYMYTFWYYPPFVSSISRIPMSKIEEEYGYFKELIISTTTGLLFDIAKRIYYIKYVKDNKFVMTIAINKDINFIPEVIMPDGTMQVSPKDSFFPIPERKREPLPCDIFELKIKGATTVDEKGERFVSVTRLGLDLSDYGIKDKLKEDSAFKIHQFVDYSKSLKKYAFIGRVYKSEDKSIFTDYLFLVDEKGGKPEPIIEMKKGKDIEDMIFSPKGDKLVLDIDKKIYILTF